MCFYCCFWDIDWQIIWTALGSIATIVGIIYAIKQLRVQVFNNLQRIFTENEFRSARSAVLNGFLKD